MEDEVLLKAGTQFIVKDILILGNGLKIIQV